MALSVNLNHLIQLSVHIGSAGKPLPGPLAKEAQALGKDLVFDENQAGVSFPFDFFSSSSAL